MGQLGRSRRRTPVSAFPRVCAWVQEVVPEALKHFHSLRRLSLRSNKTVRIEDEVRAPRRARRAGAVGSQSCFRLPCRR